jgi:UDP-2-acetamido-2-deoxy-ribo-hexuluronate aminotransferase
MKKIEMVDLKSQYEEIKVEINSTIQEVMDAAAFIRGSKVSEFQKNLENYLQVKHVIPVGNGTDALQIALMALGLKPGDEVITPVFTFIATVEVIALLGLKPVFVDVDDETFNISVDSLKKAITPQTKAIIPVHLFGQNADMESVLKIAREKNIYVVEDACQSIGSLYTFSNGRKLQSGCMGDIGCTSFFPSKNLGCYGDGGAIFTNNDDLAAMIRIIANHGMAIRYYHDYVGVNSRLDTIQAAILDVKLTKLDAYTARRQTAAAFYNKALGSHPQIKIPGINTQSAHVYHQYTIILKNTDRGALQKYLSEKGIPAMIYYPVPLHLQRAYQYLGFVKGDFPIAEYLCESVLSLPMHTELDSEQLHYITSTIIEFLDK